MVSNRRRVLGGIGTLIAATVAPTGTTLAADDGETAGLRVAHASPDAPAVDVYVDGTKAVSSLSFRSVTDYLEPSTGSREVAVKVAGTDTTVFGPVTLDLAAEDYTAVARGEVGSDDTEFTVDVLEDTNGANLGDEARVRAIHASPDAPAVDVTVDDDALTLFDDLSYGSSSGYTTVPAGSYEAEIRPAGGGEPVFEADVDLSAGSTDTAFAVGYLSPDDEPSDESFGVVLTTDATAPPRGDDDDADTDEEDADEEGADEEEADESEATESDQSTDDTSDDTDADEEEADEATAEPDDDPSATPESSEPPETAPGATASEAAEDAPDGVIDWAGR